MREPTVCVTTSQVQIIVLARNNLYLATVGHRKANALRWTTSHTLTVRKNGGKTDGRQERLL